MSTLHNAARRLWQHLGFTLTAVFTLAIGIGLVATQFSLIDGTLLRPLPFAEGERLFHITSADGASDDSWRRLHYAEVLAMREHLQSFEGLAAFASETYNLVPQGGTPRRLWGSAVNVDFFRLLRVNPLIGRVLEPGEDQPGQPLRAVINQALWRDAFGLDPAILGRSIRLNGELATVVGVMPDGFAFPGRESVWVNLRNPGDFRDTEDLGVEVLGKLRPGVSPESAALELDAAVRQLWAASGRSEADRQPIRVARFQSDYNGGNTSPVLYAMLAMTGFVLLLGCINVAGLLSVRANERVRELAVRTALGAGRGHIVRQMLGESLGLGALGALLGTAFAAGGVHLLQTQLRQRVDMLDWMYFDLNPRVLAFIVGVSVLAALLAGVLPALRALRVDPAIALRGEGRGNLGPGPDRSGRWLLAGQLAFACASMVMAVLFATSAVRSSQVTLAYDPDSLLIGRIELQGVSYVDAAARVRFYNTLVERVQQTPGVLAAAASSRDLVDAGVWSRLEIAGRDYPRESDKPGAYLEVVTRDYFAVLNRPPIAGRVFDQRDRADSLPVALVNQSFAARLWPGEDPLGKRIRRSEDGAVWATVIGVVPDLNLRGVGNTGSDSGWYLLQDQVSWGWLELLVRTQGDPAALIGAVRAAVAAVDPDQPVHSIATLRERTERRVAALNVIGSMTSTFALAALLLAAIGTYGVMSYAARLRMRELGLRIALGASRSGVIGLMLKQNLVHAALGVIGGLLIGLTLARKLAPVLPEAAAGESWVYLSVATVLLGATALACWLPARRAAAVDPMRSLRNE